MDKPILSICIPTYNRVSFLKELLDSIVFQFEDSDVFKKTEIIISDNASEDDTEEIVVEYQKKYSNLRYVRNAKNIGSTKNIFSILQLPIGEYAWLMGDDDIIENGAIKYLLSKIENKKYSVVLINYSVGEHNNPMIKSNSNFLKLKNDQDFLCFENFFAGGNFKNFYGINFMSVLVYDVKLLKENFYKFDEFLDTCYLQSYIFLILGTKGKILRIAKTLVVCRYILKTRRYDEWQKSEFQIWEDLNKFVDYANALGYVFNKKKIEKKNCKIIAKEKFLNFLKKYKITKYIKTIYRIPRLLRCYLSRNKKNW